MTSTTTIIAGVIYINSVRAAPVALTKSVTAVAIVKGAAISATLTTLVKGTMKTMTWLKIKFALVVSVTALWSGGIATVVISQTNADTKIITLSDSTKLTLLGMTSGIRQMAPGYENLRTANWLYTPNKTPMLWIESENKSNQSPSYTIVVYDKANIACVSIENSTQSYVSNGVYIQGFLLNAFPRWDKEFTVRIRPAWPFNKISEGQFVVSNPLPAASITNWIPDSLHVTKSDGDLEVTLTKLIAGVPIPYRQGETPTTNTPANQCVHLGFDFRQNGETTTNWNPWPVETFDGSGNHVHGLIYGYPTNGILPIYHDRIHPSFPLKYDGYFYQPGLWPEKSPWKVRLEFIQRSGFSDDEIVTFTNLPVKSGTQQDWNDEWNAWDVGKTNFPFTTTSTMVNGVHLELLPPLLVTNSWQNSEMDISIIIGADPGFKPQGMNLTVVSATDDQGRELWSFEKPPWAGHYSIEFARVHDDVKSLNLTLALHKSRFVEFTVKPTKE